MATSMPSGPSSSSLSGADRLAGQSLSDQPPRKSCQGCAKTAFSNLCDKVEFGWAPGFDSYYARYQCFGGHSFFKYNLVPSANNFPPQLPAPPGL